MIVIDVGCKDYGDCDSVGALIEEYHPDRLYGLDPNVDMDVADRNGTFVTIVPLAAWTRGGRVGFFRQGNSSCASEDASEQVACVSLSRLVGILVEQDEVVLKLDCEGNEYELLEALHESGWDEHVKEILVEWHNGDPNDLTGRLRCPVKRWWM